MRCELTGAMLDEGWLLVRAARSGDIPPVQGQAIKMASSGAGMLCQGAMGMAANAADESGHMLGWGK